MLSKGMEDDYLDVRLAAVKAAQGFLEGEEIGDDGRDEFGSDLIGKACHVSPSGGMLRSNPGLLIDSANIIGLDHPPR